MENNIVNILLVDDDSNYARCIKRMLSDLDADQLLYPEFELVCVNSLSSGMDNLSENIFDIVLLDLFLPDSNGLDTLLKLHIKAPDVPVIVINGNDNEENAIEAIHNGAQDYLMRTEVDKKILLRSICYVLERQQNSIKSKKHLTKLRASETNFKNIIEKNADGVIIIDKVGIIQYVNPSAAILFNYEEKELKGELFGFPIVADEKTEISIVRKSYKPAIAEMRVVEITWEGKTAYLASLRDITERKNADNEREKLIEELKESSDSIETLKGLLPICACCKKVRDDKGYWKRVETYVQGYSLEKFNKSLCPECKTKVKKLLLRRIL